MVRIGTSSVLPRLFAAVTMATGACFAAAPIPRAGEIETIPLSGEVSMVLVWVPSGAFLMGQQAGEMDAYPNKETPQHPVTLTDGCWMGAHEVTKAQWTAVMGTAPWAGKRYVNEDPQSPAVFVSWSDAVNFTERLSALTARAFRLPTEAEWEYACRAGTTSRFYWGDDLNYEAISIHAWWRGNAMITPEQHPRPVGLKPPNPFGLYDMSGNVSEWCADWHWFYFGGPAENPRGPASGDHRAVRGGSFLTVPGHCRSARRNHEPPEAARSDVGFRVVSGGGGSPSPEPSFTAVFTAGQDGVNTYRIPALLAAPDGSLLAFCEARKEGPEDASPTDMVLRRSADQGQTWLPMQVLVHGVGAEALMNPCPVVDNRTGTVLLLCMKVNAFGEGHHQLFQLTSRDNGATWSDPVDLRGHITNLDDSFTPGPGVGIQLRGGRLVIPGYAGAVNEETDENWHACVLYSDDQGATWTLGASVPQFSDESQAVELLNGDLMLNMRGNMGLSCRGVAISKDGGQSWADFYWDRALNECPCQASIIRGAGKPGGTPDALLFANPDNLGEKFNVVERTKMTLRMSLDEGKTWPVKRLLHPGPASYSTMVQLPGGDIGLLFEGGEKHRREWIRFSRVPLDWLAAGTGSP